MRRIVLAAAILMPLAAHAQSTQTQATPAQGGFMARFDAANTTHDGHLTLAQAQAAGMKAIVKHFDEMDTAHAGYVTTGEIKAWWKAHRHARATAAQPATPTPPAAPAS